jgi:integrase
MAKLTALGMKKLIKPGRYGDGGNLWLQVRDAEHRSWLFRYTRHGKARQMGLGPFPLVALSEAREKAQACRRLLLEGADPIGKREDERRERASEENARTFREVAEFYIADHAAAWRNAKHRAQWRSTLETHAFPVFGDRPVADVETDDVMRAVKPIWQATPETAGRLRGRIEAVLDYAAAQEWRRGDNPARWRGHLAKLLPPRGKIARVEHHAALPWKEAGAFMAALRAEQGVAARALEFVVLTAARTGEALGARWPELDMDERVWTVPAGRIKAGKEHRVPLSDPALVLLRRMSEFRSADAGDDHVFPGQRKGKPLSDMALTMLLRRMGRWDITVHGFRSTFRDWCAEATGYPREVAEAALAHTLKDKVEAAYRRSDLFEKRARLMEEWASWCGRSPMAGAAEHGEATAPA